MHEVSNQRLAYGSIFDDVRLGPMRFVDSLGYTASLGLPGPYRISQASFLDHVVEIHKSQSSHRNYGKLIA